MINMIIDEQPTNIKHSILNQIYYSKPIYLLLAYKIPEACCDIIMTYITGFEGQYIHQIDKIKSKYKMEQCMHEYFTVLQKITEKKYDEYYHSRGWGDDDYDTNYIDDKDPIEFSAHHSTTEKEFCTVKYYHRKHHKKKR